MNRNGFSIIFLSLIISTLSLFPASGQNPFIPKYDAVKRSERCFTVTWDAHNQFGAVWWADKVDFSKDTLFNFVVYMGDRDDDGADGLAFVMHQDPRDTITDPSQQILIGGAGTWDLAGATGDDGGGLGFAMHESRVNRNTIPGPHGPGNDPENHKIQPSVAIELDTWNNHDVPDGGSGLDGNNVDQPLSQFYNWDHTAVIYNGDLYGGQQIITDRDGTTGRILPLKPYYAFSEENPDGSPHHNIEDNRCYTFQIRWEVNPDGTQNLQLWADVYDGTTNTDSLELIMTHTDDMIGNVFGGDPVMRFGFTGATGGSRNEQTICLLGENLKPIAQDDYASIPMNTTAVIDVEANDNDPDGDQLYVPVIIEPPRHGAAVIFNSLDVNYVRYTPNTNYVGLDTIRYVTCDVDSIKCYAKCDSAFVYLDVGCVPFDITVNALSPNTLCDGTLPQNGSAEAKVTNGSWLGILWSEDFDTLANGTTSTPKWTMDESNANYDEGRDHAEVRNNRISISDIGDQGAGHYVTWSSEVIDISSVSDVSVTVDLEGGGNMESGPNQDYINVYYKIDGGSETPLSNGTHRGGNFTAKASVSGLNGSTLQIVVRATNSANNEYYYFDNVIVKAVGAGTANMSYNWYRGTDTSGAPDFVGQIYNNMYNGLYTVVGVDLNTGCLSNPQTVTIDSAGARPVGGYIIQAAPFTNCELPYDGQLEAGVYNGTDSTHVGYLFQWYIQEQPTNIIHTGHIASGLKAREYTVRITDLSTGCDTTLSAEVPNAVSIPTVTATKIADVTSCTDPNSGIGEANVGGVTNGYRFEWYTGPAIGAGPPDFTGPTVNTFPAGTFAVQAIDMATSCPSDPATINIADLTALPIIQVTVDSEQISCDTLNPTGQLSGAVDESGVPATTGYTFNWYKGPNDLPSNLIATGSTAGGLEAGPYRLVVTEDGTNCTSFLDTLIQDRTITPPDISVSSTDVTSCAAPNGSITITVAGDPSDYSYDIYRGNGVVQDSLLTTSASNNIQGLEKGNYTVVARDLVTKCTSNPAFATINDATVLPDANIISAGQISCDPSNPTGQLTANMSFGTPSDHTFNWYEDNLSGTPIAPSNADGNIISNLDSGNYALRITNNTTQCTNEYYPSVNIAITLPVETVSSDPSTHCGASANGALHGLGDGLKTGYTFIWYSVDNADTLASNSADVHNVEPGDYILTVINNTTACASNPASVTVADNTIIPDPDLTVTNNSSCDVNDPNGEIRVTSINNEGDPFPDNYDFKWYDGSSSGPQLGSPDVTFPLDPDSSRIAGLDAGTVALVITNTRTSCSNEVLSEIKNINIKPIIDAVNPDPAENCVEPFNSGAAVVSVNGGLPIPAGYSFEWTNLDSGTVIPANGSSIVDVDFTDQILPPGNYMVVAYNEYNCPSDPVTFEIADHAVPPVFSLTASNNISCNPTLPVGGLVASRPAGSSYSISQYEWYLNAPAPGNEVSAPTNHPDSILHGLGAGNYAVRITDAATGCTSTEFATIQDLQDNRPLIATTYIKDLTSCTSPDGELGLEVAPLEQLPPLNLTNRTYTFYTVNGSTLSDTTAAGVLKATTIPGGPAPADSEVSFSNLGSGDWTSIVVDNFTHCVSTPLTVGINEAPSVTITLKESVRPSGCNAAIGNGELKFEASSPLNTSPGGKGYTFSWTHWGDDLTGSPVSTDPGTIVSMDGFSQKRTDLYYGYYVVSVIDDQSGCTAADTAFLPIISAPPVKIVTKVNATECKPGNGQILVEATQETGGSVATDYELLLYRGSVIDPGNELRPADVLPAYGTQYRYGQAPADFVINLPPGTYTVATRERLTADKCFSEPVSVHIGLNHAAPLIDTTNVADMTCNTAGTGELNATANGGTAGFNFQWYDGTDTTGVAFPAGESIAGLLAGNYTIKVEDTDGAGRGCRYKRTFSLPKVLKKRIIVPDATNNSNCDPYNGIIEIVDIEENGTGVAGVGPLPLPDYHNFTLYNSDFDVVSTNNTAAPWNTLAPGDYFINAEHMATSCITQTKSVKIDDDSKDPVIRIDLNALDYACDPALADGELEAFVDEGGGVFNQDPADYDFNWYKGDTSSANFMYNNPLASNLYANASTQLYTVEVEDKTGLYQGCKSIKAYTLIHQPTSVYARINWENQTKCYPNGSIKLDNIYEYELVSGTPPTTTVAPFTGRYTAQLLESDYTPSPASYGTFDPIAGHFEDGSGKTKVIPTGTYYVRAKNDATGCPYGPFTKVIIQNDSRAPIVSLAASVRPDYACSGGTNTGELTPEILGGSDHDDGSINPSRFTVKWTDSDGSIPMIDDGGGTTLPRAINLAARTYTVEVIDTYGADSLCATSRSFLVPAARHDIAVVASGTNQSICIPDGTLQVDDIKVDHVSVVDPHLTWTTYLLDHSKSNIVPAPPESGFASDSDPFGNLQAGKYYVQTQDNLTKCYSDPYPVTIRNISTDPVIDITVTTPQYSLNPNPASWTGALQASVVETNGVADPGGYTYAWHSGLGTGSPAFATSDNISMADEGFYTLSATNNNTGCASDFSVHLPFHYLEPTLNTLIGAKTICSPLDGSIEVTDIYLDGNPDQLSDYTFYFYHDNYSEGDPPDSEIPGNNGGTVYEDINSGSFYLVAEENWWMIESYPVKVEVIDSTTNPIVTFDAINYHALTSCDPEVAANGALAIEVYEDLSNPHLVLPPTYSYAWYKGDAANPGNLIADSNSSSISGLPAGSYTVVVTNLENLCEGVETYTIEDESITPVAISTMSPVTNCPIEMANGIVTAQVINSNENFEYLWYSGSEAKATPDFVGDTWYNKTIGYYTVVAIDEQFGTCISEPVVIEVEDATVNPNIMISEIHPITNCDPEKPNAVVSASADGGVSGYTFDWYENNKLYYSGPVASNLGNAIYKVVVTNNVTQCKSSKDIIPSVLFDEVPPPEVTILSELTSCISPDGKATATIEGNVKDYIFRYYRKHDTLSVDNLFIDNIIYDLDALTYLVTAEDRITGCVSNPTEFSISNEQYYPEIDVITDPSDCREPNGAANVIISDMTRDFKVTWIGENGFETQQKELVYIPIGKYTVEVEGTDGCITSAEAEVKGDVIIYNGVSANYDGLNDFFAIVCLEYFPDNNVKIYNRAGLLVYEQNSYDMNDPNKRFEGYSNQGASVIGTELPIGTYFYVVDKNDGSKAKVGYLELNR